MDWGPPVLLVDDLSVLLSLGVTAAAVLDFSHYCRTTISTKLQVGQDTSLRVLDFSVCATSKLPFCFVLFLKGNVVMLTRCDGDDDEEGGDDEGPEKLLKGLTHQCSLTLHVQGLPTGFCRDIHGQVRKYYSLKLHFI